MMGKEYHRKYYLEHKEQFRQTKIRYIQNHRSEFNERKKTWRQNHKLKIQKSNAKYYQKNKGRVRSYMKKYWQTERGRNNANKHKAQRRKNLGFDPINKWFPGSHGHHINKTQVVYIPKELHTSVWHRQKCPKTMSVINAKVVLWLLKESLQTAPRWKI